MHILNNEEARVLCKSNLSLGEIRYVVYVVYCDLPHRSNCDVVPQPVKMFRGVVPMDLKDQYMSIWYGLVCRGSFYRCPIKALTTMRTYAVALSYLSYIGVPTPE